MSLSSDLMTFVQRLSMSPYRLHVQGTAGSGKSQLAAKMYGNWNAEGKKVLMVCFNNALQQKLRLELPEPEHIKTFFRLCTESIQAHGHSIDFSRTREPGFWRELAESVIALDIEDSEKYDALIVDEGQDFDTERYEILRLFLRKDASILWLDDPSQNIYSKTPAYLDGFVHINADFNFRTPQAIAEFIRKTLGIDFESRNTLPGLGVNQVNPCAPAKLASTVGHRVMELRRNGFDYDDIVILSCVGLENSRLYGCDEIPGHTLRRFTGEYDGSGDPVFTDGQLLFDNVYRFKGQQAPVVILVDVSLDGELSEFDKRLLFVAMTRATVALEIVPVK